MSEARSQHKAGVIVPAAGFGTRMQSDRPKQFLELSGEPILCRTIKAFLHCPAIDCIVIPVAPDWKQQVHTLLKQNFPGRDIERLVVTEGGATRQLSVESGLKALPGDITLVLVHDGARPLISTELINRCLGGARVHGAVIAAIPVNDTLKQVDTAHTIIRTVDRNRLYRAQTPQAAQRHLLEKAYQIARQNDFCGTDEASLLEHASIPVTLVAGEEQNIKITRPGDLQIAAKLLGEQKMMRIGHGFDAHRLVEGRPLILGGEHIDFSHGLLGHSDADVLTHALIDALLGAIAEGDIGAHFPDSDSRFKGINSLKLLEQTVALVEEKQYVVVNADLTVICQQPKLAPYLERMRRHLAAACKSSVTCINIKATTTEHMGYTGRGEGIGAHAVVLLQKTL